MFQALQRVYIHLQVTHNCVINKYPIRTDLPICQTQEVYLLENQFRGCNKSGGGHIGGNVQRSRKNDHFDLTDDDFTLFNDICRLSKM